MGRDDVDVVVYAVAVVAVLLLLFVGGWCSCCGRGLVWYRSVVWLIPSLAER